MSSLTTEPAGIYQIPVHTFSKGQRVRVNPLRCEAWHPSPEETFVIRDLQTVSDGTAQLRGHSQIIALEGYPGGMIWSGSHLEPVPDDGSFRVMVQKRTASAPSLFQAFEDINDAIGLVRQMRGSLSFAKFWLEDKKGNIIPVATNPDDEDRMPGMGY